MNQPIAIGGSNESREGQFRCDPTTGLWQVVNYGRLSLGGIFTRPKINDAGSATHATLVEMFSRAGFQTQQFRRTFAQAFFKFSAAKICGRHCYCSPATLQQFAAKNELEEPECPWRFIREYCQDFWQTFSMIPDAFWIVPEERLLVVVEVDVTHHPAIDKYVPAWWWLDAESWSLCELHCDRYGQVNAPRDHVDLWYRQFEKDVHQH